MLLKFFENFTGKNLCWSLFLIKFLINFKFKHTMEGNIVRKPRESVLISLMQSWFNYLNRNFNLENSVSVLRSLFRYWHWNFSFQILISVMKSQFQNPNFSFQILISVMKSQLHHLNPILSFQILISVMKRFWILELPNWVTKPSYAKWRHTSSY